MSKTPLTTPSGMVISFGKFNGTAVMKAQLEGAKNPDALMFTMICAAGLRVDGKTISPEDMDTLPGMDVLAILGFFEEQKAEAYKPEIRMGKFLGQHVRQAQGLVGTDQFLYPLACIASAGVFVDGKRLLLEDLALSDGFLVLDLIGHFERGDALPLLDPVGKEQEVGNE